MYLHSIFHTKLITIVNLIQKSGKKMVVNKEKKFYFEFTWGKIGSKEKEIEYFLSV